MALMTTPIKSSLLALVLLAATTATADAATFTARRGINLDIWVTWPAASRWSDPDTLLPYPEWRRHVTPAELGALKRDGFDFVRMPVDPAPFLSDATAPFRDRLFASVLDSVRLVRRAGLKVVVDLHLIPGGDERGPGMELVMEDPAMFDRYLRFTGRMAETLAREDPKAVSLELMNEPVLDCPEDATALWPPRLARLHAAAREKAPRLTLVLSGACYADADALARLDPSDFDDHNLLWTFHSYRPFVLTHQGATWAGDFVRYVTGLAFPPYAMPAEALDAALRRIRDTIDAEAPPGRRAGMRAYLDEQLAEIDTPAKLDAEMAAPFDAVAAWAKAHGVPSSDILLGEFGMIRQEYGNAFVTPPASRAAYYADMIRRAEAHGFPWALWSYGGAFGIVEAFEGEPAEPAVLDMIRALPPAAKPKR